MLVRELEGQRANSLLALSPLWRRDITSLRPLDLQMFLRSHWGSPVYLEAKRQVDALVDAAWASALTDDVESLPILQFEHQPEPLTIDELRRWLSGVSITRRRAVLFGLETGMPIQDIVGLTWQTALRLRLRGLPLMLIQACPRHIRLNYVFWEPMPNLAAAPLFGLGETFLEVSQGLGYEAMRRMYHDMILIDREADCYAFFEDFARDQHSPLGKPEVTHD